MRSDLRTEGLIHSNTLTIVCRQEPRFNRASPLCTDNPLSWVWNVVRVQFCSELQVERCLSI